MSVRELLTDRDAENLAFEERKAAAAALLFLQGRGPQTPDTLRHVLRVGEPSYPDSVAVAGISRLLLAGLARVNKDGTVERRVQRILFLDDDAARARQFCREAIGQLVSVVTTAREAIDRLAPGSAWDMVYLDHDLTTIPQELLYPDTMTGEDVVAHLEEVGVQISVVVVHSLAECARQTMVMPLRRAGYMAMAEPWGWQWSPVTLSLVANDPSFIREVTASLEAEREEGSGRGA